MRNIFLVVWIVLPSVPLRAQSPGGNSAPVRALEETGRIIKEAQASSRAEAAAGTADNGGANKLAAEAKSRLAESTGSEASKLIEAANLRLEPALRDASPEGRVLIAQSAAAPPAMRAPDSDTPVGGVPSGSAAGAKGPDGKKGKGPDAPPSDIDIRSEDAVYFDNTQALAIFTGDVVLDHPQFHMTSDKLEVYFIKESDQKPPVAKPAGDEKSAGRPSAPEVPVKPGAAPPAPATGDAKLDNAVATGKKVVIRKLDEKGELQIGICRKATYLGESGDIILREMPQVQRGNNVIIARDPSTYMVLKQNGELKVNGPANTKIEQKPVTGGKSPAPGDVPMAAPAAAPGAASKAVPKAAPAASGAPTLTPKKPAKK